VNVVPHGAIVVAKHGPYRIAPVLQQYGSFLDNVELRTVAVDNAENLYVVRANIVGSTTYWIIDKVTPTGQKAILDTASRAPTDARIGPGGQLYLLSANREIERVNVQTGEVARWHRLSVNRQLRFGDFDTNGYFYAGGTRTDLYVITPDAATSRAAGVYASDEILGVRVYNQYVYIAARVPAAAGAPPNPSSIWRHAIDASGNLGAKELVVDLGATAEFASRTVRAFTFSVDGTIYIATDSPTPLLIFNPATNRVDYLYKSIVPSYCKQFYWGTGNYLYMISGNATPAQAWTVFRIDTGKTGAPYYGG
jgi:hypothetical protein